jgi:hypothetical protein
MKDWAFDSELAAVHLAIADVNWTLASLLRLASRFELVYKDTVASFFISHLRGEAQHPSLIDPTHENYWRG